MEKMEEFSVPIGAKEDTKVKKMWTREDGKPNGFTSKGEGLREELAKHRNGGGEAAQEEKCKGNGEGDVWMGKRRKWPVAIITKKGMKKEDGIREALCAPSENVKGGRGHLSPIGTWCPCPPSECFKGKKRCPSIPIHFNEKWGNFCAIGHTRIPFLRENNK